MRRHRGLILLLCINIHAAFAWSTWDAEDLINPQDILAPDCSVDTSTSGVTDWAISPEWVDSMAQCLYKMNSSSWDGNLCTPAYPAISKDVNPRPNFLFWKAHGRSFKDAQDCYNRCESCLLSGIQKGLAVTTYCHYAAYTVGYKKATCQMGFDYEESGFGATATQKRRTITGRILESLGISSIGRHA